VTLRDYEIVYIFHPSLEEDAVNEKLTRFHALVAGEDGGEIAAVDHWGRRQLAYPIEDQTSGYYVVTHFSTDGTRLPEFERILTLDEELLRYLIVVNEGDLATTPVPPAPKREEDEEGDEAEEE
jgi:small subunit ribosomal protein S6